MPDLSFWEIFVIAISCLIFLKPEDVPEILKQGGKMVRKIKKTMREFTSILDIDEENDSHPKKTKILGLDGKYHDAYDVTEVFKEEIKPDDEHREHKE